MSRAASPWRRNLLPFAIQEAGPHFRSVRTFVVRALYLAAAGVVLAIAARTVESGEAGTFARNLYNLFYTTTYAMVCLLAPALTAHAVFRDKRAGLSSVIASAPIRPLDYCLGRLLGQVAALGAILLVGAPLFATMVFLHAVDAGEALKGIAFLALGGLLSSSLALGRAIDAESYPSAVASTYALTLFPGCLTPLPWFWHFATEPEVGASWWAYLAVATPVPLAYNLFRACTLFRRRFADEGGSLPSWQLREGRYRGPIPGNPVFWWERSRAARILSRNFMSADSLSGAVRILAGLAVLASLIPLCLHPGGVAALLGLGILGAAAQAASSVTTERERGVWPSVLSSPLSPEAVMFGKLGGILAGMRLIWMAAVLAGGVHLLLSLGGAWEPSMLLTWGAGLLAFGVLLVSLGLHASLASETTAKAMGRTLTGGLLFGAPPFILSGLGLVREPGILWIGALFLWAVSGTVLLFALPAHFRRMAARGI